ncbi:polymorphic toxin type 15 domain-containing protein [Pseudomonas sp. PS01297]|uniref:polymorphic toxin type 15 domain-containing protein n=1 Tax=Pseudomonas sp. PS01297 TaxID=2991433 RepID=UPI002499E6A8|nr:polymorphic toxin type 15 domain-containing protein [Pseudomonas sp. PS01297]
MAEPLEINISKSFVEHGGKQWATYENGGGVTVQVWKNQQLELQRDLSYTDYATFREKAPELGLRDYPAPLMRRQGGTNANGNTLGRVVGETAPTAVPATQANAAIEAETQEESITGEQVLDGLQLGLDVVGLIPVVGEAADIISAGISLARGDYVGAGLSLLSAIPFVGYAGTAGKATRYGAKIAEASGKVGKEAADRAAKEAADKAAKEAAERKVREEAARKRGQESKDEESGGKIKGSKQLDVKCFKKPEHLDDSEFMRQLKEQEDAINSMNADKMLERHLAIKDAGGTKALRAPKAQEYARKAFEQKRLIELGKLNIWGEAAEKQLALELKDLAATHRLDIIAGGDPKDISGMGGKGVNSSIGPQWKGVRSNSLKTHAEEMIKEGKGENKMHVKLKKC